MSQNDMASHVAPIGAPRELISSATSRSASVSWRQIECSERNGQITGYSVEFLEQGGVRIPGEVEDENFSAHGLTPYINYTFRVAGVNSNGTGPFSHILTILTNEEGMPS